MAMLKLIYVLTLLCIISCTTSRNCRQNGDTRDLIGTWQVSCAYCRPIDVTFQSDSTGTSSMDGYFEALVNGNRLTSFDWAADSIGIIKITWTTIDQEQAHLKIKILSIDCNEVRLWDQISDTYIDMVRR